MSNFNVISQIKKATHSSRLDLVLQSLGKRISLRLFKPTNFQKDETYSPQLLKEYKKTGNKESKLILLAKKGIRL